MAESNSNKGIDDSHANIAQKPKRNEHTLSKALFNAINMGSLDEVKELLINMSFRQINKCVGTKNSGHNVTPLLWAVYNHQVKIAKLLIENGAEVNKQGTYEENGIIFNYSPLLRAIENDDEQIVQILIDNGADVHQKAPGPRQSEEEGASLSYVKWMYPMNLALHMGNFNLIKMLMEKFDVNRIYDEGKHTCLCRAAMMFDTTVIQYMISRGAKMCAGDGKKQDFYSTAGICQFFKNLIQNSFSVQFMSDNGNTYICEQNNFRCLMSISLTDYSWTGSMIHRAVKQYMGFVVATQCTSLADQRDSIKNSDGSFDWLHRLSSTPSTLKHICRIILRGLIGEKLSDRLKLLPLPSRTVSYLLFEEEFSFINVTDLGREHYEDLTI